MSASMRSFISKRPYYRFQTTAANDGIASPVAVLKGRMIDQKLRAIPSMTLIGIDIAAYTKHKAGIGIHNINYTALKDWSWQLSEGKMRCMVLHINVLKFFRCFNENSIILLL